MGSEGALTLAIAPGLAAVVPPSAVAGLPRVEADLDAVVTPAYYGGAVQWDPHEWFDLDPARWERLLRRVEFMRLGYIRCMLLSYWYCTGYTDGQPDYIWNCRDAAGKPLTSAAGEPVDRRGNPIAENLRRMGKLYAVLDFCQAHQVDVLCGEWGAPAVAGWIYGPAEHLKPLGIAADDPRYAQIVGGLLRHLVVDRGYTCIREFNLGNEVNLASAYDATWTLARWQTSIRNLHRGLLRLGLADRIRIVGPDSGYWNDLWFNETLTDLPAEVHTYDFHWYLQDAQIRNRTVERESRLLRSVAALHHPERAMIYGELGLSDDLQGDQQWHVRDYAYGVSMASALVQAMRAGFAAGVAWSLDDAIHLNGPLPENYGYRLTPAIRTKVWGLWNSLGTDAGRPDDENLRPWFYPWSLLSRCFPKGASILRTSGGDAEGLCAVAARIPAGDGGWHLSMAVVNDDDRPQSCVLAVPGSPPVPVLTGYVYSEGLRPVDADGFPVPASRQAGADLAAGLGVTLPARSVHLYTSMAGGPALAPRVTPVRHSIDTLDGLQQVHDHSGNLGFSGFARHPNRRTHQAPDFHPERFLGCTQRVHRSTDGEMAFLTWRLPGLSAFRAGLFHRGDGAERVRFLVSPDQAKWTEVRAERSCTEPTADGWAFSLLSCGQGIPPDGAFLRIELLPVGAFDDAQLAYAELAAGALPDLRVTAVEPVHLRQTVGHAPELPTSVVVRLNHVIPRRLPVQWDTAGTAWDREGACDVTGHVGGSPAMARATVERVSSLTDPLAGLDLAWAHSANLGIDQAHAEEIGDPARAMRTDANAAEITYRFAGLRSVAVAVSLYSPEDITRFVAIQASADGTTWETVLFSADRAPGGTLADWRRYRLTNAAPLPDGTGYLRLQLLADPCFWVQQLGEVTLRAR